MSKNAKPGHGRLGPIKNRVQSINSRTKIWTKSDTKTGKFLDGKADGKPFKSVRHSKTKSSK